MLLDGGRAGSKRILKSETIKEMSHNQIGTLNLVDLRSSMPQVARDPVSIPGLDKFGLGFAINTKPFEDGRSAGSLAWAGIYSTFFWIDPPRKTCAVIMMQILPFGDDATNTVGCAVQRKVNIAEPMAAKALSVSKSIWRCTTRSRA
jgi:methyl acetate hydrolase